MQQRMGRAQELAMLRRLHTLETESNDSLKKELEEEKKVMEEEKNSSMDPYEALRLALTAQGEAVRKMKESKAPKTAIAPAVAKLLELKEQLKVMDEVRNADKKKIADQRAGLEDLLLRKFFYVPAFEIYGGVGGLYDFGPTGCSLKANLIELWRQHFVLTENMLEVDCTCLTPDVVLRTSGHVEKFTDFMVKDAKTGDCHRADKLLEDHIDEIVESGEVVGDKKVAALADKAQADAFSQEELGKVLKKWGVKAPETGNEIGDPFPFNLMFVTQIGPTGKATGYMRPETAQGIFVNFRRLLEYNGGRMPFAAAQIGLAFRNEISPRSGLLRVREFPLAEIEHFCHPTDKDHPKFKRMAHHTLNLLSRDHQDGANEFVKMNIGDAVKNGVVNNETLGYFMARTMLFLHRAGIIPEKLRFRQHLSTEMAHYAKDCWDAEILMSYGWIECVGHADRAAYDLQVHSKASKVDLSAQQQYDPPKMVEMAVIKLDNGLIGKTFRQQAKAVKSYLNELSKEDALAFQAKLDKGPAVLKICTGEEFTIEPKMCKVTLETKKISVLKYTPSVVEPSFGLGRIMYGILDHSYTVKKKANGDTQALLALSAAIAPVKCGINPLGNTDMTLAMRAWFEKSFVDAGLASKSDTSGASIGRKYARMDEIGVPYCITIDFDYDKDQCVTVRDRDTTTQVRVSKDKAVELIIDLVKGLTTWEEVLKTNPNFSVDEAK